jgi:hypothetical protein
MHLAVTATAVATEVDSSLQTINEFGRLPYAAPEDNTGSKAASEGASKGEQLASHSEAERTDVQAELEQETARRESLQEAYHNLEVIACFVDQGLVRKTPGRHGAGCQTVCRGGFTKL